MYKYSTGIFITKSSHEYLKHRLNRLQCQNFGKNQIYLESSIGSGCSNFTAILHHTKCIFHIRDKMTSQSRDTCRYDFWVWRSLSPQSPIRHMLTVLFATMRHISTLSSPFPSVKDIEPFKEQLKCATKSVLHMSFFWFVYQNQMLVTPKPQAKRQVYTLL